jgi:riboflavin biosynthesis pyrimidine reductase
LDFDLSAPLFHGGHEQTIVINVGSNTPSSALTEIAQVVNLHPGDASSFAHDLIAALADLGLRKVTCEGGPSLLTQLLEASAVDEYDLTVSPTTVGGLPAWPEALPREFSWDQVGTAISGDFEFKRLLLRR